MSIDKINSVGVSALSVTTYNGDVIHAMLRLKNGSSVLITPRGGGMADDGGKVPVKLVFNYDEKI